MTTETAAAQHTPGPWLLAGDRWNPIIQDESGCIIAVPEEMDSEHGAEESAANARLIAAAPDLLAALEAAVERASWQGISEAREAIRKARL